MLKELPIPNGTVSYYSVGKGQPLIMLCGYGASFATWPSELTLELSKNFEVFFLNYRAVGYSKTHNDNYTIPILAEDLHQFIQALNLTNVSLFSFSMGGLCCTRICSKLQRKN